MISPVAVVVRIIGVRPLIGESSFSIFVNKSRVWRFKKAISDSVSAISVGLGIRTSDDAFKVVSSSLAITVDKEDWEVLVD